MTEQAGRQPFRFRFPFWRNPISSTTQRPLQNTTPSQSQRPQSQPPAPFTNLLSTTTRQTGQAIPSPPGTFGSQAQAPSSSPRGTSRVPPNTQTGRQPPPSSVHPSKTPSQHQSPPQTSSQNIPRTASPPYPSQAAPIVTPSVVSQKPSQSPIRSGTSQPQSASLAQPNPERQLPTTKSHSQILSPSIHGTGSESQPPTVVPLELWPASISSKTTASPEKQSTPQASTGAQPQRIPKSAGKTSAKSPSKRSQVTNKKSHEISLESTLKADNVMTPINHLIQTQRSEIQLQKSDDKRPITKVEANQLGKYKIPEDEEPKRKADTFLPMSNDIRPIQVGSEPMPLTVTRPNKVEKQQELSEDKPVTMEYKGQESKLLSPKQHSSHTKATDTHPSSSMSHSDRVNLEKEIRQDSKRYVHPATARYHQAEDDSAVNVITLAGENKGAHMNISSKANDREGLVHIHRGYKIQREDNIDITKNIDESANEQLNVSRSQTPEAQAAYANSNSQSINNSILCNSSCTEKNPGIHLTLFHGLLTAANQSKERKDLLKSLKENSFMKSAVQLPSQTNIRRRCLRALFMESSDSDPDNRHKPRRHGCRYKCGEI